MRISKTRLEKLENRAREQVLIDKKAEELKRRMAAAQARFDKQYRDKLSPEEFELFVQNREAYQQVFQNKFAELRGRMPCETLAERFRIADLAADWARRKTGFSEPR